MGKKRLQKPKNNGSIYIQPLQHDRNGDQDEQAF